MPRRLDLPGRAHDLVADRQQRLRFAVEVALVEHEQPAALFRQPFQLVDERLGRADAPVKTLRAERAARPAAAPARNDRRQLIAVVVAVKVKVVPFVARVLEAIEIVHQRGRQERLLRAVEARHGAGRVRRPLAARQPLQEGADGQVRLADAHVVGEGKGAHADVGAVAGEAADEDDGFRQGGFHPRRHRRGELLAARLDGKPQHLGPGGDELVDDLANFGLEVGDDLVLGPEVVMLRLPGIGRQLAAARQADDASLVAEAADVKAMVEEDIEVARLVGDVDLLEGIVDVAQAVGHEAEVSSGAIDEDGVEVRSEDDVGNVDRIDDVAGPGRPGAGGDLVDAKIGEDVRVDEPETRGGAARRAGGVGAAQPLPHAQARKHPGLAQEDRFHATGDLASKRDRNAAEVHGAVGRNVFDDDRADARRQRRAMSEQVAKKGAVAVERHGEPRLGKQMGGKQSETGAVGGAVIEGETLMRAEAHARAGDAAHRPVLLQDEGGAGHIHETPPCAPEHRNSLRLARDFRPARAAPSRVPKSRNGPSRKQPRRRTAPSYPPGREARR
ncbi:MAG: hypothetical protein U0793_02125 [Gemmataceae bacterium]